MEGFLEEVVGLEAAGIMEGFLEEVVGLDPLRSVTVILVTSVFLAPRPEPGTR